jgi:diguanylate cyclase (GGDEF)-like protein
MVSEGKHSLLNHIRKYLILMILIILGVLGNYLTIPIHIGVDYIFGSIFTIIILYFYGIKYGLISSILINVYTYKLWNHPYAVIIFALEILFIGIMINRKGDNIILWDSLYWIIIGAPISALIYYFGLHYAPFYILLIILKNSVNGIVNTFFASIIIFYTPIGEAVFKRKTERSIPISRIIFVIIVGSVIIYSMITDVVNSKAYLSKTKNNIKEQTESMISITTYNINSWYAEYLNALSILSQRVYYGDVKYSKELQQYISTIQSSLPGLYAIYIVDSDKKVVGAFPAANERGISNIGARISSIPYFNNWENSETITISDIFSVSNNYFLPAVAMQVPISENNEKKGSVIGIMNLNYVPISIRKDKGYKDMNVTIVNENNNVISSTDINIDIMSKLSLDNSIVMDNVDDLSTEIISKLSSGKYIQDSIYFQRYNIRNQLPWKIVVQVPLEKYKEELQLHYINSFAVTFLIIMVSFLIVGILDRILTYPIFQLAKVTTDLPEKIFKEQIIHWPKSVVLEIDSLISNFKSTSKILEKNFKDIQDANSELRYIANHDPLTKLPNRALLRTELNKALNIAKLNNSKIALMFLDLDRFKIINDTLGHNIGDRLLKEVSGRLSRVLKENEKVFRIGGDEFVLLALDVVEIEEINKIASKVLKVFQESYVICGQELNITTSIGISIFPQDGEEGEILLTNADIAMYRAKEKGKNNYQFYSVEMNKMSLEKLIIENNLRKALENGEFILYYQPRIEISTEKIVGMEALIRWNSPELGMVPPNKFISIAEETGLIVPIGEWIIREACYQNKLWQDMGLNDMRVSVNLSALQFSQENLVEIIEENLNKTKLKPQCLEVEITEGTAIKDIKFTIYMLKKLKEMGIRISLDDFGTGFSSLNYLKNFKIDILKIDSSFVKDINEDIKNTAIVSSIINLAKSLNLNVTAEGVETREQLNFLKSKRCDEIQGYLFSKPLPPDEFEKYARKQFRK